MPIHISKYQQRGFNQTLELLQYFHQQFKHVPIDLNAISRITNTSHQVSNSRVQRQESLIDAFAIHKKMDNLKVLIVDDVITTGATINTIAQLLKMNGAHTVDACCLLRT